MSPERVVATLSCSARHGPTAAALASAALAVTAHILGGGGLPSACWALPGAVGVTGLSTASAAWSSRRRRRCGEALALLWLGQFGVEAIAVIGGGALTRPAATAGVHIVAGVSVGIVVVGGRRMLDEAAGLLDLLLPRSWRPRPVPSWPGDRLLASAPPVPALARRPSALFFLRGPPVSA